MPYVRKCILCYDRITAGRQPACTEACPTKATIFGDRDQLLAEAHRRIGERPRQICKQGLGRARAGGTSVLYISNVDLSFLSAGHWLAPSRCRQTTAIAMDAVPFAFTGVMACMAGFLDHRPANEDREGHIGEGRRMNRVRKLKLALWTLVGLAASVAAARFLFGLGATTNLTDANPWGVWVGFDVMGGVALAAGGFIVTATVYIFRLERFHAVVRPAVLTAFLGYLAVAVGLLFDLGLPWNIWHMMVYWNPHSPLFEVGWCVMLYLTVLTLEFFPVPAEEFPRLRQHPRNPRQSPSAAGDRRHRAFDSAPVVAGFAVSDHAVPAASAVVFADPAAAVPDFRDRAGSDDGDFRKPFHGLSVPPQAGDRPAGFVRQRRAAGCCCFM